LLKYPLIAEAFWKSNATLPSSAAVERLFNAVAGTSYSDCTKTSYGGQYAHQTVVSEICV